MMKLPKANRLGVGTGWNAHRMGLAPQLLQSKKLLADRAELRTFIKNPQHTAGRNIFPAQSAIASIYLQPNSLAHALLPYFSTLRPQPSPASLLPLPPSSTSFFQLRADKSFQISSQQVIHVIMTIRQRPTCRRSRAHRIPLPLLHPWTPTHAVSGEPHVLKHLSPWRRWDCGIRADSVTRPSFRV